LRDAGVQASTPREDIAVRSECKRASLPLNESGEELIDLAKVNLFW